MFWTADRHPLRVLIVGHASVPSGAELALMRLLPWLRHLGIEPHLCFATDGAIVEVARKMDIPVHMLRLPPRLLNLRRGEVRPLRDAVRFSPELFAAGRHVAEICSAHDIALVSGYSMKAFVYASIGAHLARCPLVWEVHDIPEPPYFSPRSARFFRWLLWAMRPRDIIVRSRVVARTIRSGQPVTVIPCGVPFRRRVPSIADCGPIRIGMAARLTEWKGQLHAIRAMAQVAGTLPDAQLLLAGAPLFGEEEYERRLRVEIRALGLTEQVKLLGHVEDPIAFYGTVDIGLHASTIPEPFGISVLDCLAAGRPVIAANQGGVLEILNEESGSVLVRPNDPESLANAILTLAGEGRESLRRRGSEAHRRARAFDVRRIAVLAARFYRRVGGCAA